MVFQLFDCMPQPSRKGAEMAWCPPEQKTIIFIINVITKLYGFGRADEIVLIRIEFDSDWFVLISTD